MAESETRNSAPALPDVDCVLFNLAPLEQVICQLRFHDILSIGTTPPADLQALIRNDYPVTAKEQGVALGVGGPEPIVAPQGTTWQFTSEDGAWTASLTSGFVALKTTAYTDFEDFDARFDKLRQAFETVYRPRTYTRTGLWYVNRLTAERTNDEGPIDWSQWLHQCIAGEYADPVLAPMLEASQHYMVLKQPEGLIGCRYARDMGRTDNAPAERFTLDFDHFTNTATSPSEIGPLLAAFNRNVYRLFRWCLTEEGFKMLGPSGPKEGA